MTIKDIFNDVLKQLEDDNNLDLEEQSIQDLINVYGLGFPLGQASKKTQEAMRKQGNERYDDLLAALNYIASAIFYIKNSGNYETTTEKNSQKREDVIDNKELFSLSLDRKAALIKEGKYPDVFVNDPDTKVRIEVAKQGYGLNKLIDDPSLFVRCEVAKQGYGLDKLINEPYSSIKFNVAKQGYGLDKLINDSNEHVRDMARIKKSELGLN